MRQERLQTGAIYHRPVSHEYPPLESEDACPEDEILKSHLYLNWLHVPGPWLEAGGLGLLVVCLGPDCDACSHRTPGETIRGKIIEKNGQLEPSPESVGRNFTLPCDTLK